VTIDLCRIGLGIAMAAGVVTAAPGTVAAAGSHVRPSGSTAAVDSDLRNAAVAEETYYTDNGSYGTWKQLDGANDAFPLQAGDTVKIAWFNARYYCLKGSTAGYTRFYASKRGGLQAVGQTCGHRPAHPQSGGSETG
jgi:hypothetical protein